ncbi:MAG TPA: hypothetical protein VGV92_02790 [Gammaproteobacteria bacterium]|nr:hypothetical protein [Gammaproteobacteria bacterium]
MVFRKLNFFEQAKPLTKEEKFKLDLKSEVTHVFQLQDSQDRFASLYFNELYDDRERIISAAMGSFLDSPAEEVAKNAVAHLANPHAEMAALKIGVVGTSLVQNPAVIDRLHDSKFHARLVGRTEIEGRILGSLIEREFGYDKQAQENLNGLITDIQTATVKPRR